jgi:hypothetical protein
MKDLLAEVKILDQRGTALADLQCILVITDRATLGCRQDLGVTFSDLMKLASVASHKLLIMDCRGLARRLSGGLGHKKRSSRRNGLPNTINAAPRLRFPPATALVSRVAPQTRSEEVSAIALW